MSQGAIGGARRAAKIRRTVEDVMSRRAAGELLPDALVIADHPDLMPDLARELSLLSMLERARETAAGRTPRPGPGAADGPIQPLGEDAFEGYAVLREVHRGGQGVVYEATQKSTGRRVAIKVMREGLFAGERDAARFEREVRILGQLEHPGVVGILGSGIRAGHFYYVMDYVQGVPLDECAASADRDPRAVLPVFERVCEAVNAAHLRGIIHRDLKPGNILVDAAGQPHILDFGLARFSTDDPGVRITATGQFVGSMPWSSPEQAAGDQGRVDLRTDVYSLGVILYQALTGRFPYAVEGGPRDVLNNILTAAPLRMRSTSRRIEPDVEAIVLKCLSKERERRYQSAGELVADLRRHLDHRPVLARTPSVGYQLRTFARRNKLLVAAGAAIAGALLLGFVGLAAGLIEASIARAAAVRERDAARRAGDAAEARRAEAERSAYSASVAAADSALRAQDVAGAVDRLAAAPERLRDWEWRYLTGQTDRSAAVLPSPPVHHALVSPDGRAIAVLLKEGSLRVLDAATQRVQWEAAIPPPARGAAEQLVACFSRDGSMLATAHGGRILVWRIGAAAPVADLSFSPDGWGYISASFRPDGGVLVADGRDGGMRAWDLASGNLLHEFPGFNIYGGLDYSADGRTVAACTSSGIVLFDGRTFEPLPTPVNAASNRPGSVGGVRFSPDGALLAACQGTDIVVYAMPSLAVRSVLRGHTQRPEAWSFSPDGAMLVSAGWDRTVRVWDVLAGRQTRLYWGHTDRTTSAGFVGGGRLVSSAADGTVRFWNLDQTGEPPTLNLGTTVFGLSYFGRGWLMSSGAGIVRFWDRAGTPQPPGVPLELRADVARVAVLADGRLLAAPTADSRVRIWNLDSGRELWTSPDLGAATGHLVFSPDGRALLTASGKDDVRLWAAGDGAPRWADRAGGREFMDLAFSADSALCAGATHGFARLWDAATGLTLADLTDPNGPEDDNCVAFSPDGTLLAVGDSDGCVQLWDIADRRLVRRLSGMNPVVWSVAFNPSGTRLATGSQDRMARIWDPLSGDDLLVLRGHTGTVITLAWSPDGQTLATGSYDGTVRVWNAAPARR